eukprot:765724-Hanusia_phi.AAC.2
MKGSRTGRELRRSKDRRRMMRELICVEGVRGRVTGGRRWRNEVGRGVGMERESSAQVDWVGKEGVARNGQGLSRPRMGGWCSVETGVLVEQMGGKYCVGGWGVGVHIRNPHRERWLGGHGQVPTQMELLLSITR